MQLTQTIYALGNSLAPHIDIPTLGQRLTEAGVRAGYIGKWHLDGTDYFGGGRCAPGWDPECWFDGLNYLESLPDDSARDLSRHALSPRDVAEHGITAEFTHAHRARASLSVNTATRIFCSLFPSTSRTTRGSARSRSSARSTIFWCWCPTRTTR